MTGHDTPSIPESAPHGPKGADKGQVGKGEAGAIFTEGPLSDAQPGEEMKMAASAQHSDDYPSNGYAAYVIAVLMVMSFVSLLDRSLPSLLVEPLSREFGIGDTKISLLQGMAFGIFYSILGVPIGRLADIANRRNLIMAGLVLWSAMTALAGFAKSYEMLLLTRISVGIGEACLPAAAYSIIADYVRPHVRGKAIAIFYSANAFGAGASLIIGGMIYKMLTPHGLVTPFGVLEPWRGVFFLAGVPGLFIALILLTIREPKRRSLTGAVADAELPTLRQFGAYFGQNRKTLIHVYGCYALMAFVSMAIALWAPTFYVRTFNLPIALSGILVGVIQIVATASGIYLSGWLSDRWVRQNRPAARFRINILAWPIMVPAAALWSVVPSQELSLLFLAVIMFACGLIAASGPVALIEIFGIRMRGLALSIHALISGLVGLGLAATAVALATDYVFVSGNGLAKALLAVPLPAVIAGLIISWTGMGAYQSTVDRVSDN